MIELFSRNDLNKQSGKTNGAAADCEETLLNERNKDVKSGKGISNEELNDGNSNILFQFFLLNLSMHCMIKSIMAP